MRGIKWMLLWIIIALAMILFHLFIADKLITDLAGIAALFIAAFGFFTKD